MKSLRRAAVAATIVLASSCSGASSDTSATEAAAAASEALATRCAGRLVAFDQTTAWERFVTNESYAAERRVTIDTIAADCGTVEDLALAAAIRHQLDDSATNRVLDAYRGGDGSTDANPIGGRPDRPLCTVVDLAGTDPTPDTTGTMLAALSVLSANVTDATLIELDEVEAAYGQLVEVLDRYAYDIDALAEIGTADEVDAVVDARRRIQRFRSTSLTAYEAFAECPGAQNPALVPPCVLVGTDARSC